MRLPRRYLPIAERDLPARPISTKQKAYCRKHFIAYPLNQWNNGRIEAGKCPKCFPSKPPVPPAGSSK